MHEVLFKCVVENDLTGVKTYVESGEDVNGVNEEVSGLSSKISIVFGAQLAQLFVCSFVRFFF